MTQSFRLFLLDNSDMTKRSVLCNGTDHVEKVDPGFHERTYVHSEACDGSCKPEARRVDVRRMIDDRISTILPVADETEFPNHVALDDATAALHQSTHPIVGIQFYTWYQKHGDRGMTLCLGTQHLTMSEKTEWCSRNVDDGVYHTYSFTMEPCDGTCKPKRVKLSGREQRDLRV